MIKLVIKNRYWMFPLLIILIIWGAGCSIGSKDKDGTKPAGKKATGFVHKSHTEGGIRCENCHLLASKKDEAGMPNEMLCGFCHKTVYDNQPIGEIYNLKTWQQSHLHDRAKYKEVKMSHQFHLSVGVHCKDCHGNVAESTAVIAKHIPVKAICFSCHEKWNTPAKCDTCHKEIRYDIAPAGHKKGNFIKMHGQRVRDEAIHYDNFHVTNPSCYSCHSNEHCIDCHQDRAPDNHNNQWRLIGHGITAGIDRNRCTTCHKTDFCVRCHEGTKPRNHLTARWGNPNNQHCKSCHLPIGSTNCIVCHKSTLGHFEGSPGSHSAGWGNPVNKHCANCHIESSTCSVCHKGTPSHSDTAPASHTARWGSPKHNHCVRCHLPISTTPRCNECHGRPSSHFSDALPRPNDLAHRRSLTCRTCHTSGGPNLDHVDNGLSCMLCHKS